MPRDDVISEAPDRIPIATRREKLEGADPDVARCDASQNSAGLSAPSKNVGKALDIFEVFRRAGWTTADMRQAMRLAALDEAEQAEVVSAIVRGHKRLETAVVSGLYRRHIRAKR